MKKDRCYCKGFTLLEMLVVLVVIGTIGMMMVGSMKQLRDYEMKHFTHQVQQMILETQQLASMKNSYYQLIVDNQLAVDEKAIFLKRLGAGNRVEEQLKIPSMAHVTIHTEEEAVTFNKDMSPVKAATIRIKDKKTNEQIRLTIEVATGKVNIYTGDE